MSEVRPDGATSLVALRALRIDRGMTQAQVAAFIGIGQSAYARLEKGHNSIAIWQLRAIALQLGVSTSSLV